VLDSGGLYTVRLDRGRTDRERLCGVSTLSMSLQSCGVVAPNGLRHLYVLQLFLALSEVSSRPHDDHMHHQSSFIEISSRAASKPLLGLTTECDLRPAFLNVFPGKILCTAQSSCRACLVRALQKARPHGVPTESSWWTTSSSSPMQARLTIHGRKFVKSFMQTCEYRRRSRPYSQVASSVRPTG